MILSYSKSLNGCCAGSHFYGSEFEIWAVFGPVGNTEKKIGADYEQFLRPVFSCFRGQKNVNSKKNIVAFTLKRCIISRFNRFFFWQITG